MGIPLIVLTDEQKAKLESFRRRVVRTPPEEAPVKLNPRHLPGDPVALRGVPCLVAGGCGGVIPGTRPGDSARKLERDDAHIAAYRSRRRPHLSS